MFLGILFLFLQFACFLKMEKKPQTWVGWEDLEGTGGKEKHVQSIKFSIKNLISTVQEEEEGRRTCLGRLRELLETSVN